MRSVLAMVCVVIAACSINEDPADESAPTTSARAAATTTSTTSTTTEPPPQSSAIVRIGPAVYELDAVCAAGGAGEVEVSMVGADVNGLPVVGYVRAFLGAPYVALQVGEGPEAVLFEPRLEGTLPFDLTDVGVTFEEVDFVTELDLESGEFTPAGIGSVYVACLDYVRALPPIPFE